MTHDFNPLTTVMVVDDDATTRFLMSEFLDVLGYSCVACVGGTDCLNRLKLGTTHCALIFMDIHMPGVTGLDASRSIRSFETDPPRSLPIIAVTADTAYHSQNALTPFGLDDVLAKPVNLARLRQAIEKHLPEQAA